MKLNMRTAYNIKLEIDVLFSDWEQQYSLYQNIQATYNFEVETNVFIIDINMKLNIGT